MNTVKPGVTGPCFVFVVVVVLSVKGSKERRFVSNHDLAKEQKRCAKLFTL